ncbi:hypothetical protein KPH14_002785 [Odynerus spinipes]|uniref:Uncharacterized protein n=1 Tax=Odynerus spinipes TaxID=1348599 RepID=A0AAD9RLQ9_9HYME|nr:hypothetical protein KPH14_002785 [Odynerus spinipes]
MSKGELANIAYVRLKKKTSRAIDKHDLISDDVYFGELFSWEYKTFIRIRSYSKEYLIGCLSFKQRTITKEFFGTFPP